MITNTTINYILSNGYHNNKDSYKNFDFCLGYVFASSMTVQSFITVKWKEKKLTMIKIFKFFVSDHLNHLKTNSTKFVHYRLKIRKVNEIFDFQSLMQHPLTLRLPRGSK